MTQNTALLNDLLSKLEGMSDEKFAEIEKDVRKATEGEVWIPNTGPQKMAFESEADVLLYGGQGGGGKTDLEIGLSFLSHKRSLVMRRHYTDLTGIVERAIEINGTRKGYNGSIPPTLRTVTGSLIEFGAAANPGDESHWQGRPHDLLCVDEAAQFLESQIRFLMGWVRSADSKQRTRVVFGSNPPLTDEGQWMFEMFRPWLDDAHDNPAAPGELRWYITDSDGKDKEVEGGEPVVVGEKTYRPTSRTFIPAQLSDNPHLMATNYQATLDGLPEPLRSAIRDGDFKIGRRDNEWQLIPSQWIYEAQERWTEKPPQEAPMCAIGVDVAQGGTDHTVLQIRYDHWFARPIDIPGKDTPNGRSVAAQIIQNRVGNPVIVVDVGGGYGGATVEHLESNNLPVIGYNGARASSGRTRDRQLKFLNKRASSYWRLREALDPSQPGGSFIALPPDRRLTADLMAVRYEPKGTEIKIESKADIKKRLGRSTDFGDAVVMAWDEGPVSQTHGQIWRNAVKTFFQPEVHRGHEAQRRRRH